MTIWKTLKTLQKNSKEELIFGVIKWKKKLKEKDKIIKEKNKRIRGKTKRKGVRSRYSRMKITTQ